MCAKSLLSISILLFAGFSFSQNKVESCSNAKIHGLTAKSPTLTPAQNAEADKYDVTFYQLNLKMTNTSTYISGDGTMKAEALQPITTILVELYKDFTIDSVFLNGVKTTFVQNQSVIEIPANILTGSYFTTRVFYRGTPPTAATNPLGGAGMSNGTDADWGAQITWSLSEPFSAYEWFPVKQTLRDKADSCAVNVTVANSLKAGSNGNLENIINNGDGTHTFCWFHRHPIAYYLISVAVSNYEEYDTYAFAGTPQQILIQNYIYPGSLPSTQQDIDNTANYIELYSNLYGMYPFNNEKYGHCLAPIGGGMEHQTMTTQSGFQASLTAHELAHQWFGDYVTCDTWANIWLNEGFASYSEYLMWQYLETPSYSFADMNSRHNHVMSQLGGSVWVQDSTDDAAIFDSRLTYDKGAAIIHTMRYIINDDTLFFHGLRQYLNTYKNKTATVLQFKDVMEAETGINFDDFFSQWYFGEGYPSYKVTWNEAWNALNLNISQTTSTATTTLFTNPIDLKISRFNSPDTIIRVNIISNNENLFLPNFPDVKNVVSVDPNNWVINKVTSILKDPNLFLATDDLTQTKEQLKIYPVPAKDFVNIETLGGDFIVEVLDESGKLVKKLTFKDNTKLDVSGIKQGTYILKISKPNFQSATYKLIKI